MATVPLCGPCKRSLDREDMTHAAMIRWALERSRRFEKKRAEASAEAAGDHRYTAIARAARKWGRAILGRCSGHYDTQGCPKCRKEMKACQAFWEAVVVLDPQLAPLADFRGES